MIENPIPSPSEKINSGNVYTVIPITILQLSASPVGKVRLHKCNCSGLRHDHIKSYMAALKTK